MSNFDALALPLWKQRFPPCILEYDSRTREHGGKCTSQQSVAELAREIPRPASQQKLPPAGLSNHSISYDANAREAVPNVAKPIHLAFIQRLHAAGESLEEITKRVMDAFPDLCKSRGDDSEMGQKVTVRNTVELNTSM